MQIQYCWFISSSYALCNHATNLTGSNHAVHPDAVLLTSHMFVECFDSRPLTIHSTSKLICVFFLQLHSLNLKLRPHCLIADLRGLVSRSAHGCVLSWDTQEMWWLLADVWKMNSLHPLQANWKPLQYLDKSVKIRELMTVSTPHGKIDTDWFSCNGFNSIENVHGTVTWRYSQKANSHQHSIDFVGLAIYNHALEIFWFKLSQLLLQGHWTAGSLSACASNI